MKTPIHFNFKVRKAYLVALILPLFVFSCSKNRPTIQPRYHFTPSEVLRYQTMGEMTLGVNAGLVKFNGNIQLKALLELKVESTNTTYGNFLRVNIKNVEVSGVSGKIKALVLKYVNYVRILFAGIYITDDGKVTILYKNQPHSGLSSYGQMIFSDFSDMNTLWNGQNIETNFNGKFQKQPVTIVTTIQSSVGGLKSPNIQLSHHIDIATYDQKEYQKSSDPQSWGAFTADLHDTFNYLDGMLTLKDGEFNFDMSLPIRQGFFSYVISVQGNGSVSMKQIVNPVL